MKTTIANQRKTNTANQGSTSAVEDMNVLTIPSVQGEKRENLLAAAAMAPIGGSAITARLFSKGTFGDSHLMGCVDAVKETAKRVQSGNLGDLENALTAQAIALDKMFNELARRAVLNMGAHLDATECYLRLALKAQNQCRSTIESIGNLKNPTMIYAKQANISHGPQQVNNSQSAVLNLKKPEIAPNELLCGDHHEATLDARTQSQTSLGNSHLDALEEVHRTANR